uniref:Acyl_transf_3 domain-containing protein n=1 Tax=Panagrellus redivivus TaxID=6233 RepID=A0A7E4VY07_PANRE
MRYNELQGLRGLAIVAVVLYHLWPKIFYNGFLGVDVFFVLSGFLMAETQLKSLPTIYKFQQIPLFWYRRIHRIVPLSILNVLITWIIVTKKITVTNLMEITKESLCALSFTLNICKVQETKFYFDDIDLEYFKHYWSLAVEMQFYAIVPFLFVVFTPVGFGTHYFVEKPLLNAKIAKATFIKVVIVAYAVILLTIFTTNNVDAENEDFVMSFYTQDASKIADPDAWRRVSAFLDSKSSAQLAMHAGHVHCQFNSYSNWTQNSVPIFYGVELQGTGNKSYLIAGNSHAECVVPGIEAALGVENYKELNMVAIPALTPFPGFKDSFRLWQFKESVEHYKPDVILMTFKYQQDVIDLPLQYPIETDPVVTGIQSTMNFLSERVEKIFINGDHFQNEHTFNIWRYAQSAVLKVDKDLEFDREYKQKRFANLHLRWQAVKCPKCILLDMWPAFCTDRKCSPLDPMNKVPLFWDDNHYTLFGSYKAMPVFRQYFIDANLISNKSSNIL